MEITKENFGEIFYCDQFGSTDIAVKAWYNQETGECFGIHKAAVEEGGVCNNCNDVVELYTWDELCESWVHSEAFVNRTRDGDGIVKTGARFNWFPEGTPVREVESWFNARNQTKKFNQVSTIFANPESPAKAQNGGQILAPNGGDWNINNK